MNEIEKEGEGLRGWGTRSRRSNEIMLRRRGCMPLGVAKCRAQGKERRGEPIQKLNKRGDTRATGGERGGFALLHPC
jgi:hypothetical protein